MLYANTAATFYTAGEDNHGTSKYFIYLNGTIRAKVAENSLHVRPEKNMMFVRDADVDNIWDTGVNRVAEGDDNALTITLDDDSDVPASKVSSAIYDTPLDMNLSDQGIYEDGLHPGHTLVAAYDGGNSGITEAQCDAAKVPYVNNAGDSITAVDNVNVAIV